MLLYSGYSPNPVTVTNEGFPTKNVIILVVTVTGQGDNPSYTSLNVSILRIFELWCGGRIVEIKRQFKRSFAQSDQGIVGGETCFLDKVHVCHVPPQWYPMPKSPGRQVHYWVVVPNIFYFHPYLGKIPILTYFFKRG